MKKYYEAPEILFEDFTMSTSIAGSCNVIINNATKYNCAYYDEREEKFVFTTDFPVCTTTNPDGMNGVCYDVPLDTTDLFNS